MGILWPFFPKEYFSFPKTNSYVSKEKEYCKTMMMTATLSSLSVLLVFVPILLLNVFLTGAITLISVNICGIAILTTWFLKSISHNGYRSALIENKNRANNNSTIRVEELKSLWRSTVLHVLLSTTFVCALLILFVYTVSLFVCTIPLFLPT